MPLAMDRMQRFKDGNHERKSTIGAPLEAGEDRDGLVEALADIRQSQKQLIRQNADMRRQLSTAVKQMERACGRMDELADFFANQKEGISEEIAIEAVPEIAKAVEETSEKARKEILDVAKAARSQIEALDRESRERTMRLLKILLPERVFKIFKWVAVIVVILAGGTILIQQWM